MVFMGSGPVVLRSPIFLWGGGGGGGGGPDPPPPLSGSAHEGQKTGAA